MNAGVLLREECGYDAVSTRGLTMLLNRKRYANNYPTFSKSGKPDLRIPCWRYVVAYSYRGTQKFRIFPATACQPPGPKF